MFRVQAAVLATEELERLLGATEDAGTELGATDEAGTEEGATELEELDLDELAGVPQPVPVITGISADAEPLVPWKPNSMY